MTRLSALGFWVKIAFLFLYRSRRATIALSLMLVAAVSALIFLSALAVGVVSLGLACAFVIFILKNLREYGIMKAMGVTRGEMTLLIIIEVVVMNRVDELLEKIGMPHAGAAMPHELSGGEIQRVSIARAIAHLPRMLLADEPTASLDTATGKSLVKLLFDMDRETNCTMILSTHDPDVSALANRLIEIGDGTIVREAT